MMSFMVYFEVCGSGVLYIDLSNRILLILKTKSDILRQPGTVFLSNLTRTGESSAFVGVLHQDGICRIDYSSCVHGNGATCPSVQKYD